MKYRHQRSGITSFDDVTARLMANTISTKMEGYKAKQLHMQERKHKLRLLGSSTTQEQQQRGTSQGSEGEEAENEGILVKDWFVTKPGPKKIRAEIIF